MGEKMKHNNEDIYNRISKLEDSINELSAIITNFMGNWGPEVQQRRAERDEKWDEMVRVLSIQKRDNDG